MCIFEFDEEKYREVIREDGYRAGFIEGFMKGFNESFNDGFNEGLAEGRLQVMSEERKNNIRRIIRTCRSLNVSKQETLEQLIIQCSLDTDTAREYLDMHWD